MSAEFTVRAESASLLPILCFLIAIAPAAYSNDAPAAQNPTVETIVSKLVAANSRRAEELRGYRSKRLYRLDYHGFLGSHSAQLTVEATYTAPDKKNFKIISQSGSKLLVNRVLLRLLDSEKEAFQQKNRSQMELNPKNYNFSFIQVQPSPDGDAYILDVQPRRQNKFLYSGKIWVNAKDFAVTRMEGEPATNPSLWTRRTKIEYTWTKIGDFWLPSHNRSVSQVRLGGNAVLTIDYSEYQTTRVNPAGGAHGGDKSVLPDPDEVTPSR